MAAKDVYETVKQAIQDVIAPDLERIKGELVAVRAELKAMDDRITSLRNELHSGLRAVDDRIDALKDRQEQTNKRLDEALDIRERLAAVEAKLAVRG